MRETDFACVGGRPCVCHSEMMRLSVGRSSRCGHSDTRRECLALTLTRVREEEAAEREARPEGDDLCWVQQRDTAGPRCVLLGVGVRGGVRGAGGGGGAVCGGDRVPGHGGKGQHQGEAERERGRGAVSEAGWLVSLTVVAVHVCGVAGGLRVRGGHLWAPGDGHPHPHRLELGAGKQQAGGPPPLMRMVPGGC